MGLHTCTAVTYLPRRHSTVFISWCLWLSSVVGSVIVTAANDSWMAEFTVVKSIHGRKRIVLLWIFMVDSKNQCRNFREFWQMITPCLPNLNSRCHCPQYKITKNKINRLIHAQHLHVTYVVPKMLSEIISCGGLRRPVDLLSTDGSFSFNCHAQHCPHESSLVSNI